MFEIRIEILLIAIQQYFQSSSIFAKLTKSSWIQREIRKIVRILVIFNAPFYASTSTAKREREGGIFRNIHKFTISIPKTSPISQSGKVDTGYVLLCRELINLK